MSDKVYFIDTTVRDGNQSLWALNMKIGAIMGWAEIKSYRNWHPEAAH